MIYKIFCDSGDVVWDMSSGWGTFLEALNQNKLYWN